MTNNLAQQATDPAINTSGIPAAYSLMGRSINGWKVVSPLTWGLDPVGGVPVLDGYGTGGNFSAGYHVERDGKKAFLKAIDLSPIRREPDVIRAMKRITDSVNFEREIHQICSDNRMDKVILAIDSGEISLGPNIQDRVPYIILELADGDVRRNLRKINACHQLSWKLRALHHTATGLGQLHAKQIAHQDLKPSNVMHFADQAAFKIGDFGRSAKQGSAPPHEELGVAGDLTYAPPELLYGQIDPNWVTRRIGCDLYLLGSLIVFFFLGQGTTPLIMDKLDWVHKPVAQRGQWGGIYKDVLPYVRNAFTIVLQEVALEIPDDLREDITNAIAQLCDPDPSLRGHPRSRAQTGGNPYELSRYISLFDRLAQKAEILARRSPQ